MVGLISGVPTSAAPRLVLQISDLHLRRYPIHKTRDFEWQTAHTKGCQENRCGPGGGGGGREEITDEKVSVMIS